MGPLEALERAWARSDRLFDLVPRERWLDRGIELRHPFVFYVGHLPAFAWNHIGVAGLGRPLFHPDHDVLFARGIDPATASEAHASAPTAWPDVDEVLAYRDGVRDAVRDGLGRLRDPTPAWLVLEHELMHHETLLYMIRQLEPEDLVRPEDWRPAVPGLAPEPEEVEVAGGAVRLGADPGELDFGWDNEFPSEIVSTSTFRIDRYPVTIDRFREFVEAGGYTIPELWDAGDRQALGLEHPLAWRRSGEGWQVRSMFRWHDLDDVGGWPVYVSLAEARAWCRFAGRRLPTEAELHRAAFTTPDGGERAYPWGDDPSPRERAALDFSVHGRTRVGLYPQGRSAWGVDELVGNGWEWTDTLFLPRAGFRAIHENYPGYSADFFDGEHFVVFGGSWATDHRLVRRSFRNWYQRRYPYVFAKFRTATAAASS